MSTTTTTDRTISALAERQHGVVARRQLTAAGLSESEVQHRVAAGRLLRLYRGVYAVGHRQLRREGWWMAAVLTMGSGALLSHRDAAALHGVRWPHDGATDVTVAAKRTAPRGIRLHRSSRAIEERTVVRAIPTTSLARTLVDLADVIPPHQLARALNEAERLRLFDLRAVESALRRTRNRAGRGPAAMRRALRDHVALGVQLTRSELEDRFLALILAEGIAPPRMNASAIGLEVDALWPAHRFVVELDGWAFHRTRQAWQRAHDRDNALEAAGYRVRRFTYDDVVSRSAHVAAAIRAALRRRA
jgi:predicted transcriptional regulator of viral defense system